LKQATGPFSVLSIEKRERRDATGCPEMEKALSSFLIGIKRRKGQRR
jgi:hypothetical protein